MDFLQSKILGRSCRRRVNHVAVAISALPSAIHDTGHSCIRSGQVIYIERVNGPFLAAGGSPAEYRAGIERAIAKGWLWRHESGTYVKFTDAGAELFA